VEGLTDKGNLDDEVTTLDSMDMMDSESEFSVWLGFELYGVEDNEDRRSALSDLETTETDSACVETAERPRNWHNFFS